MSSVTAFQSARQIFAAAAAIGDPSMERISLEIIAHSPYSSDHREAFQLSRAVIPFGLV